MRPYEMVFFVPPTLSEQEITAFEEMLTGWITDSEGSVTKTNRWGRRRLAYPVQNYKEGFYILIEFEADPASLDELDRRLRLDSTVMRFLIIRRDE